jgi:2-iminobutanoate/2-iminopropanoate deaminase
MAKREIISTDRGPRTGLPYSQAVRCADLVFVAGQVALDPATGQVVEGGIGAQTRRVLDNVQAILRAAGTSLDHAVETTCFLRDVGDFAAFNDAYRGYFPKDPPARTTVQAGLPREGLMVEIRVVAAMPGRAPAPRAARRPTARAGGARRAVTRRR